MQRGCPAVVLRGAAALAILPLKLFCGNTMPIHVVRSKVTPSQLEEMLEALRVYVKLAVDIEKEIVAGGGEMHADCEAVLLRDGSVQDDVWGADWDPYNEEVGFTSLINLRPAVGNRSMRIEDQEIATRVEKIVKRVFQGTAS